jgi:hypothetical protein
MPDMYVSTSGVWKKITSVFVSSGGVWKRVTDGYVSSAGVWKKFLQSAVSPSIAQTVAISRNNATYPSTLTGTNYRWTDSTSLTYVFQKSSDNVNFVNIGSPTSIANPSVGSSNTVTYPLTLADMPAFTSYYRFAVTATNSTYSTTTTSTSSSVSVNQPAPVNTVAPTITPSSGTVGVTQFSVNSNGTWDPVDTDGVYQYLWQSFDTPTYISAPGTNNLSTYTPPSNFLTLGYLSPIRCRVTATNASGSTSAFSNTATVSAAATAPGAPTGLTATDEGSNRSFNNGRISLSWTAPSSNGGSAITGYFIERSTDGVTYSSLVSNTGSTSVSYANTSLSSGQIYYYRVSAINSVGTGTASNVASAIATTIPQTPTIAFVSRTSNTQVLISFSGSSGGSSLTSLTITSSPSVSLSHSGTSSPVTVTGTFILNTSYTFTISTTNANGTSGTSSASSSITPNVPTTPSAPQSLSRSTGDGRTKTFTWSAPADDGGSSITGYEYSIDGGSSYLPTSSSTSQSYTYSFAGSGNTFHVRAKNSEGNGTPASLTSFTLPEITTAPAASSVTASSATVSWASSSQSSYSLAIPGAPSTPYTGTTATSRSITSLSAATTYTPTLTITSSTSDTHVVAGAAFTTGGGVVAPSNVVVTVTSSTVSGFQFYPGVTLTANTTASGTTPFTFAYTWRRSATNSETSAYSIVGTNSQTLATNSTYNNRWVRCTVVVTNSAGNSSGTSINYFISDAV